MRIVYVFLFVMGFSILNSGCDKVETLGCQFNAGSTVASATEVASIESYIAAQNLTGYTKADAGYFYKIEMAGGSKKPELCDNTTVAYDGKLTNGNRFDQSSGIAFQLGGTIEGWKKGVPLIGEGGKIKLIIPPSLGYGTLTVTDRNGAVTIPSNSILVFEVSILDIQ
jgi:FKBP-type peptidyl-prolyl cis-trans isomerase FkpA